MKLKTSRAPAWKPERLAIIAGLLGSAVVANAQQLDDVNNYFYGSSSAQTGSGGTYQFTSGYPGGFSVWQVNNGTKAIIDDGTTRALSPGDLGDPGRSMVWQLGGHTNLVGPTVDVVTGQALTEEIQTVTLWVYASALSPNNQTNSFNIYTGTSGNDGTVVGSFSVTDPTNENTFIGIDIPLSVAFAGFSIGSNLVLATQDSLQVSTDTNSNATRHPGFAVQTILVPEPSTALLGSLGMLAIFRRRRNSI